jgi:diguanylate cyclase (GGDEF)-like protein/PAS domain S-box-containing protein
MDPIDVAENNANSDLARRHLRLFRRLLDRSNDLIYAVDADTARLLDANDAVSRRLGYSHAELMRMTVMEFSLAAAERPWHEAVQLARSVGSSVFEGQYRAKDGVLHSVEIGLSYVEEDHHPYVIVVGRDISERKRQQEQIARLSRLLRMQSAINSAVLRIGDRDELLKEACEIATTIGGYDSAGVAIVDPDGRLARPQYHSGARRGPLRPHDIGISDGTVADTSLMGRALRTGQVTVSSDLTQSEPPVQLREELYRDGVRTVVALPLKVEGAMVGVMGLSSGTEGQMDDDELLLLQDITLSLSFALRSQRQADTIRYLAYFDPVTGLAKRSLFCQRLESVLQRCFGPHGLPAVVAFDIEQLSHINERFGGNFGDLLLKEVAERLRSHCDSDDRIGYLGGGTFVLVEPGPGSSDENMAALVDSALFAKPFSIGGRLVRVTGRTGVGRPSSGKEDGRFLLEGAEAALQRCKEAGALYRQYPLDVHSEMANRFALEYKLRRAIEAGQFELYYRPQFDLASGRIRSFEALLRWHDPESGLTLPNYFLPVLESSGMINTVGNWVFQSVVDECRRLQTLGIGPVRIAVNISALQIRRRTFVNDVIHLLRRWSDRADGYGVDLEITEAVLLQDVEGTSRRFRELRAEGVRIALDNYGVGHASLGLLAKLPLDLLKIDRSLIRDLQENPVSRALVASISGLASACGLTTVAKGVSDAGQLEILRGLNCDQWQGELFGPPVREHELERLLNSVAQRLI